MNDNFLKIKNENGSVTLFVLIAMLFFLIVAIAIFTNLQHKLQVQNSEVDQIKKNYQQANYDEYLENTYNDLTKNMITVNFSMNGGEFAMPTTGKAKIGTTVSIVNDNPNISIDTIYYQWSEYSDVEPTNWTGTINDNESLEKNDCDKKSYYLWIKVLDNTNNETISVSKPFVVRDAIIDLNYKKEITAPLLNVNITFDSILTDAHKYGYGDTSNSARNNREDINVSNNSYSVNLDENGYIYLEATDIMGNLVYKTEQITNIDNEGPIIEVDPDGGDYELVYEYI